MTRTSLSIADSFPKNRVDPECVAGPRGAKSARSMRAATAFGCRGARLSAIRLHSSIVHAPHKLREGPQDH